MPTDPRQSPPRDIFAVVPSTRQDQPSTLNPDQASVSGLFLEPGLKQFDEYKAQLQENLGIEHLNLDCQPRIRLIFLQREGQKPIIIPDNVEEWVEQTYTDSGYELAARVLGAKHSSTQLSCDCSYQNLKFTISFIPYGDDALLYNRTSGIIHVQSVPNQLSVFDIEPDDFATIYPGCWRICCDETSIDFRLRPRRYRIIIQQETTKRAADQASSSKRIKDSEVPGSGPRPRPRSPQKEALEASTKTISRQVGSTGLGPWDLTRNQTLNIVDEVTGKIEYSIKYLDRFSSRSDFQVFKAVIRDGSPRTEVVAVKMPKLGDQTFSTIANDMLRWQREVSTHDKLRHPCIASLIAFDARLLSLMTEHKDSRDLADAHWRTLTGPQADYFKGNCSDACIVAADMASALAYLTKQGIVHNDIAPKNILYTRGGIKSASGPIRAGAVLIDFGESRAINSPESRSGGRPWYVAPEWVGGERGLPADIWSLGVVMLYLLRRLRLPERSEPNWWIAEIPAARHGSAPLKRKLEWLKKVNRLQDELEHSILDQGDSKGEKIRRLAKQMLEEVGSRISAHDLAEETREWVSISATTEIQFDT